MMKAVTVAQTTTDTENPTMVMPTAKQQRRHQQVMAAAAAADEEEEERSKRVGCGGGGGGGWILSSKRKLSNLSAQTSSDSNCKHLASTNALEPILKGLTITSSGQQQAISDTSKPSKKSKSPFKWRRLMMVDKPARKTSTGSSISQQSFSGAEPQVGSAGLGGDEGALRTLKTLLRRRQRPGGAALWRRLLLASAYLQPPPANQTRPGQALGRTKSSEPAASMQAAAGERRQPRRQLQQSMSLDDDDYEDFEAPNSPTNDTDSLDFTCDSFLDDDGSDASDADEDDDDIDEFNHLDLGHIDLNNNNQFNDEDNEQSGGLLAPRRPVILARSYLSLLASR